MRIKATLHANNFECFTYKMAEKTAGIDKKENVTVALCIPARKRSPVQKQGAVGRQAALPTFFGGKRHCLMCISAASRPTA